MIDRREDITFNTMAFPSKLYALLEDAEREGFTNVISWQPGGMSFNVHQQDLFSKAIMQAYFSQTKFKSFQRQLNIYGWKKVQLGPNKGGYEHKHFVRGQPELCDLIYRRKETRHHPHTREQKCESFHQSLSCVNPADHMMMPLDAFQGTSVSDQGRHHIALSDVEVKSFYNFFSMQQDASKTIGDALATIDDSLFCMAPTPLHPDGTTCLKTSSSLEKISFDFLQTEEMNEELDCFISLFDDMPPGDDHDLFSQNDGTIDMEDEKKKLDNDDTLESDHSFPFKLHLMLDSAERDSYAHIVSWVNGGTAFKVHDNKAFVDQVMSNYFDQSKYESFRRQLNLYQFQRVAKGDDRGVISHPYLVQGSRHLCKEITKRKA